MIRIKQSSIQEQDFEYEFSIFQGQQGHFILISGIPHYHTIFDPLANLKHILLCH